MMAELPEKEFEQHITETKKRDEALKYPHRRSASLDHIVPISQGGHHTRKNVQLAHLGCNIQKRASRGHQLRLIG
ncbi:MAG: HNH endonuclease [Phycisphaerae bacterium]|nr:HNH endonuclease [Phycisphaerae bacterium]